MSEQSQSRFTPGPWRWELNLKSKQLQLCGGRPQYDLTVMGFERWGMGSATARLRKQVAGGSILEPAQSFAQVARGREHHAEWFQLIKHPDADLIAAAPDMLEAHRENERILSLLINELQGRVEGGKLAAIGQCLDRTRQAIDKAEGH